ncbi:MAG TPA: 23S rRNA (adenine(2030)-N(6))-methyltransferase RlmJ [Caulobacteraceae bacterium]|jgi:23S rRNA (adenine2030-N6)-methyltransferase|nr:23S rRNA (adenine(2030)-N(6))-methyltransferase RlmJ [Caulobacteraceae bacterium]
MNYRHAFHAGNHTEVFKHAALILVVEHLLQKPQPFAVLDTHAGLGLYDLTSEPAQKTREYEQGVARVFGADLAAARTYLDLLTAMNPVALEAYPGSPEIVRRLLRGQDRLIACELHPADFELLKARYRDDPRVFTHHRDGYEAIGAFTPPPERRGLVFIDPPYEAKDEAQRLALALAAGLRKWPTGTFMAWYPIKDRQIAETLSDAAVAEAFPKTLRAEFLAGPEDGLTLAGGGLIICNAPWRLDEKLAALGAELDGRLGAGGGRWAVDWLTAP